jgi:hypothetical protein
MSESRHRDGALKLRTKAADESSMNRDSSAVCKNPPSRCDHCPGRTPFRPDPENLARAKELAFLPPLDEGIRDIVIMLVANGVETFESCEGGRGHSFPEPTVRFEGGASEGLRAVSVALENGLPVRRLRQAWGFENNLIHGPWWEMTFSPPKDSPQWADRDTSTRPTAQREAQTDQ